MPRQMYGRKRAVPASGEPLLEVASSAEDVAAQPLAARMRPRDLDEFLGQEHLVGEGTVLRRAIEARRLPSMILWGPPGSGKTTLARIAAQRAGARFVPIQAVSMGVADLRAAIAQAIARRRATGETSVLFIDEIHRFNKAQQDAVLPFVENGDVTLIGATTENPSFEVNSALLSRSRVYVLKPLTDEHVRTIVERALADAERGLAGRIGIDDEAREFLVRAANGDARVALNALELAAASSDQITLPQVQDALQRRSLLYDRAGDQHYDTISAFIKSVRGSDPDAAVYWLIRMIDSGEDPMFIARRLVILAAEDVGLADPQALVVASAAQQATHLIGFPEGYFPLAEATIYLAAAPKSDSVKRAYGAVIDDLQRTRADPVPLHLRNAVTGLMSSLGYGRDYKYAHDRPDHFAPDETYLPESLAGRRYYEPTDLGVEARIKARVEELRRRVAEAKEKRPSRG